MFLAFLVLHNFVPQNTFILTLHYTIFLHLILLLFLLVTVDNIQNLSKFCFFLVYEESLWTSGNRLTDKTSWRWLSGESVKEFYWNSGEPNNAGGEECISIKRQGDVYGWNDALCNQLFYYICEYPIEQNNCQNSCNQTPVVNVFIDNKPKTIY